MTESVKFYFWKTNECKTDILRKAKQNTCEALSLSETFLISSNPASKCCLIFSKLLTKGQFWHRYCSVMVIVSPHLSHKSLVSLETAVGRFCGTYPQYNQYYQFHSLTEYKGLLLISEGTPLRSQQVTTNLSLREYWVDSTNKEKKWQKSWAKLLVMIISPIKCQVKKKKIKKKKIQI